MKRILFVFVITLFYTTAYAADDVQYVAIPYNDTRHHNGVFALMQPINNDQNLAKKVHSKLREGTAWSTYPGGEKSCPRFTFRTLDAKQQIVGYALFFKRTDTGKGFIDVLNIDKNHTNRLYPFVIETIVNTMHNDMNVACVTIYNRDHKTRNSNYQLEYDQLIKAGFTEATPDEDEAYKKQYIRLEYIIWRYNARLYDHTCDHNSTLILIKNFGLQELDSRFENYSEALKNNKSMNPSANPATDIFYRIVLHDLENDKVVGIAEFFVRRDNGYIDVLGFENNIDNKYRRFFTARMLEIMQNKDARHALIYDQLFPNFEEWPKSIKFGSFKENNRLGISIDLTKSIQ